MKFLILTLCMLVFACSFAQKKKANVLSYYAVTNSIDGQPLINERNLLRFYPVFALRDSITAVKVTIYYGSEVFIQAATKFNEGLYWEVKLPEFDLGDAIQRYEVQTDLKYDIKIKQQFENYKTLLTQKRGGLISEIDTLIKYAKKSTLSFKSSALRIDSANNLTKVALNQLKQNNEKLSTLDTQDSISSILKSISLRNYDSTALTRILLKLRQIEMLMAARQEMLKKTDQEVQQVNTNISKNYLRAGDLLTNILLPSLNKKFALITYGGKDQKEIANFITSQEFLIDSLKSNLINKLTDKDFSGIGIQKSDIVFDRDYKTAKILYRNYRIENRTLVALDPAERLSIFRLRYIPFPVIGNTLEGPSRDGIPIVFEAGITFGNQVITSNEFTKPELSIRRLGVAVAFTPQLFSKDAKILALLFSYDFNAYASIGVGANFGTLSANGPDPYFSFGINQKAFQRLVVGIANIFR